jgi:hypothetical protein
MAEAKQAWDEVGSRFGGLGLKLKMHFEQARAAEGGAEPAPGPAGEPAARSEGAEPGGGPSTGTSGGPSTDDDGRGGADAEVKAALRKLADALDGTFEAVGNAVRDPAVKDDVRDLGKALSEAFSATFAEVSDDLRKAFRRRDEES